MGGLELNSKSELVSCYLDIADSERRTFNSQSQICLEEFYNLRDMDKGMTLFARDTRGKSFNRFDIRDRL